MNFQIHEPSSTNNEGLAVALFFTLKLPSFKPWRGLGSSLERSGSWAAPDGGEAWAWPAFVWWRRRFKLRTCTMRDSAHRRKKVWFRRHCRIISAPADGGSTVVGDDVAWGSEQGQEERAVSKNVRWSARTGGIPTVVMQGSVTTWATCVCMGVVWRERTFAQADWSELCQIWFEVIWIKLEFHSNFKGRKFYGQGNIRGVLEHLQQIVF
jgi:hypothetical protein